MAGRGAFAARHFDPGEVVGYYYGTLVYHNLRNATSKSRIYGDPGVMGVSPERFITYAMLIKTTGPQFAQVRNYTEGERSVYIVPPKFCVGSLINSPDYVQGDADYESYKSKTRQLPNERKANVEFIQSYRPLSSIELLSDCCFVSIVATRTINQGEELFANYDRDAVIEK